MTSTLVYCNGEFGTRLAPFRDCKTENDVVFPIVLPCRGDATNDSRMVSQHDASRFSILTKKNCLARKVNINASSRSFIPRLTYTSVISTFQNPIFHYQHILYSNIHLANLPYHVTTATLPKVPKVRKEYRCKQSLLHLTSYFEMANPAVEKYGWTAVPRDVGTLLQQSQASSGPAKYIAASSIKLPDSPLVQAVHEYAKKELPLETFNHSMRVYYYGNCHL
jgi:hypothetical protein